MKSSMIIKSQEVADFLTTSGKRGWLNPFFFQEVSQKDVADCFGITMGAVYCRVKKLLQMGLIEMTKEEVVEGHLTKYYRAASKEFVVPLSQTSNVDLEEYNKRLIELKYSNLAECLTWSMKEQSSQWAVRVSCDKKMGVVQSLVAKDNEGNFVPKKELPNAAPSVFYDGGFKLSKEKANELREELVEVYQKYRKLSWETGENEDWYRIDLAFVKMNVDA